MITEQQENIIKDNLKILFKKHINRGLKNLIKKIALDTKGDLVKILETDDKDTLIESKLYINDFIEIFYKDLEEKLELFIKEY